MWNISICSASSAVSLIFFKIQSCKAMQHALAAHDADYAVGIHLFIY